MIFKKPLSLAVSAALGLTTFFSPPLSAQNEAQGEDYEMVLEEVIVTGTRIVSQDGFGQTSPVAVVGMEDISSYGLTRVEDILNNLPQIEASQTAFVANGATGTASIDLRGLGSHRTLVLINSRRMQASWDDAADVNQIPTAMIERVEVLTGGASATYGADAVAGVVNFIMRRVDGVEFSAGISGYQHDNNNKFKQGIMDKSGFEYPTGNTGIDGKAYNFDFIIGGDLADGKGNATVFASWRKNDELLGADRDYSSCSLNIAATFCGGSANAEVPNFFIAPLTAGGEGPYGYDYYQEIFVTLQPDSSLADWDGTNLYNWAPPTHAQRPDERWSAGAFADFEVNEHAVAYLEILSAHDSTRAQIAESGTFFDEAYPLPISNALFPDAFVDSLKDYFPGDDRFGIYIGKRNTEGGPRSWSLEQNSFRIVAGVKGMINRNWDYDASYLQAQTSATDTSSNDLFAPKIFTAVNSELCAATAGCIPYEVFTYQGVTTEQADTLDGTAINHTDTSISVFNAYVTGDTDWGLTAGNVMAVFGYEWREHVFEGKSDEIYEQGALLGMGGPWPSVAGSYRVNELFTEFNVPLLADRSWARQMTLDLAYRWSDYTNSGSTSTFRLGLDWQIVDALRIRTGYNRAVRAPNINELFFPQTEGLWDGVDPCSTETPVYSLEQCARTGVAADQYGKILESPAFQYNALYGGNPDLKTEKADTTTFGIVVDASDTMRFSVDYWDIKIEDVISEIAPQLVIEQCAEFGSLCEAIERSGNGSLWQGTGYVAATNLNLGEQHWRGIDTAWAWQLGDHWNFDLIGTYTLKKETTPIPNDPDSSYDCVGIASPACFWSAEWRHTFTATYDSNSFWALTGRWRFYSEVEWVWPFETYVDGISATSYLDVNAVFRIMESHDLILGMNNVLDEEPPLISTGGNGFYEPLGRYLYARATFRW